MDVGVRKNDKEKIRIKKYLMVVHNMKKIKNNNAMKSISALNEKKEEKIVQQEGILWLVCEGGTMDYSVICMIPLKCMRVPLCSVGSIGPIWVEMIVLWRWCQ